MRLRPKITLAMFTLSLLISGLITILLYRFIERQLNVDIRNRLHDVAHIGSHAIDLAAYQRLSGKLGELDAASVADVERSADYLALSSQLQVIRSADPSLIRFVYILAPTDDPAAPRFVVDADVATLASSRHGTEGISHFGQRYDASRIPKLVGALRDCAVMHEADFVYDDEFHVASISAYVPLTDAAGAPLRDGRGRCIGVLGVDVTVHEVEAALAEVTRLELVVAIVAILLTLIVAYALGKLLTRSVVALTAVVKRFAAKEFSARTPALPRDEIGELGQGFDAMAEIIELHNDHLEHLVEQRTQELMSEQGVRLLRDAQLAEAHAEVRDVRAPGEGRYTGRALGGFQLGVVIGRGAMAEVYEATGPAGQPVAVKVLAAQLLGDGEAVKRFQREARAIASLDTPHIVKLIDVSPPDAPLPYIVMERLRGTDLNEQLKDRPIRELAEVVEIVTAVAAGLDAAHAAQVVHRDLKPANVFAARVGEGVTWKLIDFGVSKLLHVDATLTTNQFIGTPSYMAPEQAQGNPVDARTDIYALGVMTYRLLTGHPVVMPNDATAMIIEVVFRMPGRPSDVAAISPQVEAVLAIALAKQPDERFATAGAFAEGLAAAAAGRLPPDLIERATAILARCPWGTWLAGSPIDAGAAISGRPTGAVRGPKRSP